MAKVLVEVLPDALQLQRYYEFVADPGAGATSTFTGTTRDTFEGKRVVQLDYEAYEPMAKKALQVRLIRSDMPGCASASARPMDPRCAHGSGMLQS